VVLDVGTGSGILAFFAIQAGASKVYAVEASNVAESAAKLVEANKLSEKIVVIKVRDETSVLFLQILNKFYPCFRAK
jgi:ribosomal protein L11 methylase PrmA